MARRWVRFEMPVMVCVEVDEQYEAQDSRSYAEVQSS